MGIVQLSVIKNACLPEYPGGVYRFIHESNPLVDAYVIYVDRSTTDSTYEEVVRVLDSAGKPYCVHWFEWEHNYSLHFNSALDCVSELFPKHNWVFRKDSDVRFSCLEELPNVRNFVLRSTADVIRSSEINYKGNIISHVRWPAYFLRVDRRRYDGVRCESPELNVFRQPRSLLLRQIEILPIPFNHFTTTTIDAGKKVYYDGLSLDEYQRLLRLKENITTVDCKFRIASRLVQLFRATKNDACKMLAEKTYRDLVVLGYEVGDCYFKLAEITACAGKRSFFLKKASKYIGDELKRLRLQYFDNYYYLHKCRVPRNMILNAL